MNWNLLPTAYADAVWAGKKRYQILSNSDGTISLRDLTDYYIRETSFPGASEINRMNEAINQLMEESHGIKPRLSVHTTNGAMVTVTGAGQSTTVTATNDVVTVDVPTYGTYTVEVTFGGSTRLQTVSVDTVKIYTLTLE